MSDPQAERPGHARSRLAERYGIDIPREDWPATVRDVIKQILDGRALMTSKQALHNGQGNGEVWVVKIRDRMVRVLYDASCSKLITVFPPTGRKVPGKRYTPPKPKPPRT